jgi:hypothetical protein
MAIIELAKRAYTSVGDQIACNNPTGPIEAVEAIGDCDQRRADYCHFNIDQVETDHESSRSS